MTIQPADERGKDKIQGSDQKGNGGEASLSTTPTHIATVENGISRCIFKIPRCLTYNNDNSYDYQPKIVSIGPYHHGDSQLQWIQGHKQRFQDFFLSKMGADVMRKDLVNAVTEKNEDIRKSYSEDPFGFENEIREREDIVNATEKMIEMMVLDGCFLLGLFMNYKDPTFSAMPWVLPTIRKDLLLLENQLPLFILLTLLETAKIKEGKSKQLDLNYIALRFFNDSFREPIRYRAEHSNHKANHLLDLIRKAFIPPSSSNSGTNQLGGKCCFNPKHQAKQLLDLIRETIICIPAQPEIPPSSSESGTVKTGGPSPFLKLNSSARKLRSRGITFKAKREFHSFLDITFENGKLQIPEIVLDDFISLVLLNCIAYEQLFGGSTNDITSYAMFMGSLINNARDASFLVETGIIENYYGTDDEVSQFFKRITKDYVFEIKKNYLASVFKGVKEYADDYCKGLWASFKYNYFNSPWIAISTLTAVGLILMTILQVYYASKSVPL